jgi:hypothetical protein
MGCIVHESDVTCDSNWLITLTHGSEVERTRSTFSFGQLEAEIAAGMKTIILFHKSGLATCIVILDDEHGPEAAIVCHQQQRCSSRSIGSLPSTPLPEWVGLAKER